jgi:peroxiredoxin
MHAQNWQSYQVELTSLKLKQKNIPNLQLQDIDGKEHSLEKVIEQKPYTLFIFFSPSDCSVCLEEKTLWRKLQGLGSVNVIGISPYKYYDELKQWITNVELSLPVLYDRDAQMTTKLGIIDTPTKILVDSLGQILLVDGVRSSPQEQEAFVSLLAEYR